MQKEFDEHEAVESLKMCATFKAPGPDGVLWVSSRNVIF